MLKEQMITDSGTLAGLVPSVELILKLSQTLTRRTLVKETEHVLELHLPLYTSVCPTKQSNITLCTYTELSSDVALHHLGIQLV
jgi:hypothetical protein